MIALVYPISIVAFLTGRAFGLFHQEVELYSKSKNEKKKSVEVYFV